jgi:hypothetical protein
MGEHTYEVMTSTLGMSAEEYEELAALGVFM